MADFIPEPATLLTVAPLALVNAVAAAAFVARLHARRGVRTAYTRKLYHFIIITVAAGVHMRWGLPGVATYGAIVAAVVLAAVARGAGDPFYESLARPTDRPHRSLFVIVPLFTTAIGGLLAALLFPAWAHVGYLAVAWGDAVGEPVGARWGRHPYRVPSLAGVAALRTLEGSAAVAAVTTLASFIALAVSGVPAASALATSLIIGLVCTAVEAVSHHGLDNLTLQLAAAGLATVLLGG